MTERSIIPIFGCTYVDVGLFGKFHQNEAICYKLTFDGIAEDVSIEVAVLQHYSEHLCEMACQVSVR